MTAETENLVLELLRGMRAEIAAFRAETEKHFTAIEARLGTIEDRVEAIETQLEGIRYVLVASVGSIATDLKDHETRIVALETSEGARA